MALVSYRADSYLVLAGGRLGGLLPENGPICPPFSPLSSGNIVKPRQGNLCLPGKLREAGKEKINSGCLGFLARPE